MLPERKTQMITMNRIYSPYNDRLESALVKRSESGIVLAHSYKIKHIRDNVILAKDI